MEDCEVVANYKLRLLFHLQPGRFLAIWKAVKVRKFHLLLRCTVNSVLCGMGESALLAVEEGQITAVTASSVCYLSAPEAVKFHGYFDRITDMKCCQKLCISIQGQADAAFSGDTMIAFFFSLYIGCSSKLSLAICGFVVCLNVRNASNAI